MKGNLLTKQVIPLVGIPPQNIQNTTVNGTGVTEAQWRKGRVLTLVALGGAIAAAGVGVLKVQGQKRSDGNWENITQKDGSGIWEVAAARVADAGAIENGVLVGSILVSDIDEKYKAVRAVAQETADKSYLFGCCWLVSDLRSLHSGTTDDLFQVTHYGV